MGFVASLKKNYLRRQFSLFGWVHMTLLVVILSSHFIVDNILEVRIHSVSPPLPLTFASIRGHVGYDLVLGASLSCHLQRYICLCLGYVIVYLYAVRNIAPV